MKAAHYSKEYSPAAPVLPANIAVPGEAPDSEVMLALVDTGTDGWIFIGVGLARVGGS